MTLTIPEEVRAKAEIYVGDAAGQEKTRFLLQETGLPSGLLPLRDIIECGYVQETGFVWLKQRRKVDHYFAKAGRHVTYGAEVSAVAENGRLKKITGVKAKEMMLWVTLHEICVDDPPTGKLHCKAIGGITRSFPVEAFEAEDGGAATAAVVSGSEVDAIPAEVRAKAEIYVGDAAGQEKTRFLLQETGLPSGLLPLRDIVECGYVEETGFVWLKQRRKVDHYFAKAGRHVTYGTEVSAVAEKGRLKKITGVKAKEMMLWVTLHEICLDDPPTGKLHCKAIGGITRTFPVEAFEAEDGGGAVVDGAAADAKKDGAPEEEANKDATAAADVDEVEEKLKEMNTNADAVAAKN